MASQKDSGGQSQDPEQSLSLRAVRLLLVVLAIDNVREAWMEYGRTPALSALHIGLTLVIAVTLILAWRKKPR